MSRRKHDAYMTPRWQVQCLLDHQPLGDGVKILEPCAGDNSIASVFTRPAVTDVLTNDLDPQWRADLCRDAASAEFWALFHGEKTPDWVITNPPFQMPTHLQILEHALQHARIGVAMIGRLSFLEPTVLRGPVLSAHPPQRLIVLPRHSYTANGKTDSVTTAWMIWLVDDGWREWAEAEPSIVIAHGADA